MSQGPMSSSPSKGGVMRSQVPTGYQSPFGNQNYRSQPSQPTFNNYSHQQSGQFGGQMMSQLMRSPDGKGGYSAPVMQQPMRSPGGKGGYQPPMRQQMPSPGGKGRSYQPPPTPYGYGQSTFNPVQFGGYGQPSNMLSFSSPHYQPYVPQQDVTKPYRGVNPRIPTLTNHVEPQPINQPTNQPTGQPLAAMPSMPQTKIIDPRGAFTPPTQPPVTPSPVAPPVQNETAAKNFWSQAQKAMDSGSLGDADRFLRQYESITGTRNPMYGLSALDPSGYQSAIANR
jgi:hypothetical protein